MKTPSRNGVPQRTHKPYEVAGAGQLTATVWKSGDEVGGWRYRFNIFRQSSRSGAVSQLYAPADLTDLVKLCHVLALTLADDGCLSQEDRHALHELVFRLEQQLPCEG